MICFLSAAKKGAANTLHTDSYEDNRLKAAGVSDT